MMNKILELVVFSQDLLVTLANVPKLIRKHLWHVLYKIAHFVAIRLQTWPPQAILVSDWLISKQSSLL